MAKPDIEPRPIRVIDGKVYKVVDPFAMTEEEEQVFEGIKTPQKMSERNRERFEPIPGKILHPGFTNPSQARTNR